MEKPTKWERHLVGPFAEKRQCADLFLEASDPRAAHMAVCSDAQLSMHYAFAEPYERACIHFTQSYLCVVPL